MKESDLFEALGEIDSALVNEAYERLENNMIGVHKGEVMAVVSKKKAIYRIATVLCAAAACILLCIVAVPAIKNAISDGSDEISISDAEYITVQVEEKAMFCPVYAPNGFVMFNAEFEDDPTLGGVIEYSNTKGDVITFSYEKSSEGITATDECEIIGIGDFTGYFNETEGSLTWEENGYILKIAGISDKAELNKMACDVKNKDKISIDLQTTTAVSKITKPIRVTTNRTQAQSQTESAITTTTQQASQQIVHTGTFFVPAITTTATSCGTTHTTVCTTSTVTANPNCSQTVTTKTFTAFGTTTSTAKTTAQTTLPAVTTNVFTTTTTSFTDDDIDVTTAVEEITTTTSTTATTTWPELIEAETKNWHMAYYEHDTANQLVSTVYPCMTIVHSMEQLAALDGTIYEIDYERMYNSDMAEDYLSDEFFVENDFVIFLNYEIGDSYTIGIQSARITEDHIFELTVSHYHPGIIKSVMEMYALGIAVPKGCLDQVGGYNVLWEYFGYSADVAEGNESLEAYEDSIPDVLYIENEFATQ